MRWLNYHHLYYFWVVINKGSVTAASKHLKIAQPTISAQLKSLESILDVVLLEKKGRGLELTEIGKVVFAYAEEIFSIGNELLEVVEGKGSGKIKPLRVGIVDSVPKGIVAKLIHPAFMHSSGSAVVCEEDHADKLFANLALQELDVVISDFPLPASVRIKAFNHPLGKSGVTFVGAERFCKKHKSTFPKCLEEIPILLPTRLSSVRRELDTWFERVKVKPNIIGEFQDSALMKMVGREGVGVFPIPSVMEKEVIADYGVKVVGRIKEELESFYLISVEKRIKHPSVLSIVENASRRIF